MDYRCRQIAIGSKAYRAAIKLRERILREPQGLTFTSGELQAEQDSKHLVCEYGDQVVACAVLKPLGDGQVRLRQMAVDDAWRGKGIGRVLIEYAEQLAQQAGYREIVMHARTRSEGFYQRLGYIPEGGQFEEVSLPHRYMKKQLQ